MSPAARFRGLPLRSRLALLVAVAVAVAVAAVAAVCWVMVRAQLRDQLDRSLMATNASAEVLRTLREGCVNRPAAEPTQEIAGNLNATVQIVTADGTHCWVSGLPTLPVTAADTEVAAGERSRTLHDATTTDGVEMRVYTMSVRANPGGPVFAISIAKPLADIDKPLSTLAWVLLLVSGIGVVGAGAAGLWVARTGLRPVDELTGAVEHIARTEDLTVRIPDEGEDEIARLSRSFNSMTAALASSRDRQAQLIADAGHELRTPLTSLRTNIELLARSEDTGRAIPPEDRRELLASVKAQMTELAALIGDLQELSRPDALADGPLEVVALHEVAQSALSRARLRGPELSFTSDLAPWYVRGEAAALERAVVNVLDNAVKFSPAGGAVEVSLRAGELTVRDHGPGIPADDLPHVFERFWRSPSARALPGSGLGLSIVARTVQRAGGSAELRAARGGGPGTEAVLRIPGAPAPPPDLAEGRP
ncbi:MULTISPECIES: cell wall metabolism sensor histidine kinase WalK [unclassified Streptomyces]|uniref:sensor histidine kinase n=1 Tax=unclassified Streptomyces TaxID=2593676 RepID=UPI001BEC6781|nr:MULTISPECIES: HAMP domain-containing sensor histidine kinase [unclassified Streptomyces]MBT2408332.1 HAMP domain-containing histidine kinase [Streptomyces sp. ISL-21]MBT2457913.1 HAMP domain-containing histidine kinase [Streptomyces sp. ISL-86]MBT2611729.1 HAMP domain-containing histidine kinase [Streptomyces sp. ISL-87]